MRIALLLLLALAGTAAADVHASQAGKVSIDIPQKWTVAATDEMVKSSSPDNQVALVMWVVDTTDLKESIKKLEGELVSAVQGLKWVDKVKKLKVNGIPATFVEGIGVSSRATSLDILVMVAGPTPTKKGVIVFAAVDHDKLVANRKTIQGVFATLKRTR
jgi:hypothetical protein